MLLFQEGDLVHVKNKSNSFATCALVALAENRGKYGKEYDDFCQINTDDFFYDPSRKITIRTDHPKSFQDICRIAGKQMHTYGAAVDGCTKTLAVLLNAIHNDFDDLNADEKARFGLHDKNITHFDLLEIGLYGKAYNDSDISPPQFFLRNQNLIEIYSEKHLPSGHAARDFSFPDELVGRLNSGRGALPQECLYAPIKILGENKEITVVISDKKRLDQIFIEKITEALKKYEDGFGFFHSKNRQSNDSKNLCAALHKALDGETDKVAAVASALSENKLSNNRLSSILKEAGLLYPTEMKMRNFSIPSYVAFNCS